MGGLQKVITNADLVEAIRKVGVSPDWVQALFDQPNLFRKYIAAVVKKTASLKFFHTDVEGVPKLQALAWEFNAACDLILSDKVSDEELVTAMKTYYTQASASRLEVLTMLASAQAENESLRKRLAEAEAVASRIIAAEHGAAIHDCQIRLEATFEAWVTAGHRNLARTRQGRILTLSNLPNLVIFSVPSVVESRKKGEVAGTISFLRFEESGDAEQFTFNKDFSADISLAECNMALYEGAIQLARDEAYTHGDSVGRAVGFLDSGVIDSITESTLSHNTIGNDLSCEQMISAGNKVLEPFGKLPERSITEMIEMQESDFDLSILIIDSVRSGASGVTVSYTSVPVSFVRSQYDLQNKPLSS